MRHPALRTLPVGAARASLAGAVLLGLLGPTLAAAAPRQAFIWSAKVTCRAQELPVSLPGVGPGQQDGEETEATDVDVMSFGDAPAVVKIRAVAPANSLGSAPCSSDVRTDEIAAGHALNLTCGDFQELLAQAGCPTADAGFLLIESATDLEVMATYVRRISLTAIDTVIAHSGIKNIFGPTGTPGTFPPEAVPITMVDPSGPTVPPMTVFSEVTTIPYPASGLGIGLGHGLGIGAGVSIDVERVEPRVVRR